jgi:hypothetical protein
MKKPEIETDTNLDFLGRLLWESEGAKTLMSKSLSPFKLDLGQILFLKRFDGGEKTVVELKGDSQQSEESIRSLVQGLSSQGYLDSGGGSNTFVLSTLGRRVLDSKWDEVERLRRYLSERISPLTLEAVVGLLRELNGGYFQGLE